MFCFNLELLSVIDISVKLPIASWYKFSTYILHVQCIFSILTEENLIKDVTF